MGEGCDGLGLQGCLPERCRATGARVAAAPSHRASPHTHEVEGPTGGSGRCVPKLHLSSVLGRCRGSRAAQLVARAAGSLRCVAMTLLALRRVAHGSIWLCVWFVCLF